MRSHFSPSPSPERLRPRPPTVGPDEREAALELLAEDPELELAVGDGPNGVRRLGLRFVRAPVPDDDVAGAVLARRDHALEVEVLDGMVLDVDGHPADAGSSDGPLGTAQLARTPPISRRKS